MKYIYSLFLSLLFMMLSWRPVFSYSIPSFPQCSNPGGTIKVEYATGQHAIPGETGLYEGSDKVYYTSDNTLVQCFCPTDGNNGIQTNWWKISDLTEAEVQQLKNLGWNYIANGAAWGLDPVAYMANNISYSCGANGGNNGGSGESGIGGGQILAVAASTTGQVLGLAATGDIATIYGYFALGFWLLIAGLLLKRKIAKK